MGNLSSINESEGHNYQLTGVFQRVSSEGRGDREWSIGYSNQPVHFYVQLLHLIGISYLELFENWLELLPVFIYVLFLIVLTCFLLTLFDLNCMRIAILDVLYELKSRKFWTISLPAVYDHSLCFFLKIWIRIKFDCNYSGNFYAGDMLICQVFQMVHLLYKIRK